MSLPVLLETEDLTRAYGSLLAVNRASVAICKGELRSIIGPNGAGKTTFFKLISGEVRPTAGRIRFEGRDIAGLSQHEVCRLGIAKSYQITNIFPHLSVLENARVAAQGYARSLNFWSRADRLTEVRDRALAFSRRSASAPRSTTSPPISRTVRSATWRSPSPWPPSRRCSSSTSPPQG